MKKVSIITRAFNRLEYTVQCIDSVVKNTNYENYEHIIINNNSDDGTKQWLDWIKRNNIEYYSKVKPIHMDQNYGDWGGMIKSLDYISEDSEYIVQLDNDMIVKDKNWLQKMIYILDNDKNRIIQLKRMGVNQVINVNNTRSIKYNDEILTFGNIMRPVACFMLRTIDFKSILPKLKGTDLTSGKTILSHLLGGTIKVLELKCYMLDGKTEKSYLNYEKYHPHKTYNGKRIIQALK